MVRSRLSLCQRQALACRITRRRKLRCWRQDASPIAHCWRASDREFQPLLLTRLAEDFLIFPNPCTHCKGRHSSSGCSTHLAPRDPGQYPKQTVISVPQETACLTVHNDCGHFGPSSNYKRITPGARVIQSMKVAS